MFGIFIATNFLIVFMLAIQKNNYTNKLLYNFVKNKTS